MMAAVSRQRRTANSRKRSSTNTATCASGSKAGGGQPQPERCEPSRTISDLKLPSTSSPRRRDGGHSDAIMSDRSCLNENTRSIEHLYDAVTATRRCHHHTLQRCSWPPMPVGRARAVLLRAAHGAEPPAETSCRKACVAPSPTAVARRAKSEVLSNVSHTIFAHDMG